MYQPSRWQTLGKPTPVVDLDKVISQKEDFVQGTQKAVGLYVICLAKPFAIDYPKTRSSILYIGRGYLGSRLNSHANSWLCELSEELPSLKVKVHYQTFGLKPEIHDQSLEDAEAALLARFRRIYEANPMLNIREEKRRYEFDYPKSFFRILKKGHSPKYHWVMRPVGMSDFGIGEAYPN